MTVPPTTRPRRPGGRRLPVGRGKRVARIVALCLVLSVLCALVVETGAGAAVVPSYVALGDSYTSGPGIATQLSSTTTPTAPSACLRSSNNYPSITARSLGLRLTDVSCGSATTADMAASQAPGVRPQLSALAPSTGVVTLGIGGNDLGYSTIAENCAAYTPWGPTRVGWRCQSHYTAGGTDQLAADAHDVGTKVSSVLVAIKRLAPRAKVFVVGYPDLVPPTGSGCWPELPFTASDISYLRGVEADLNAALRSAAASNGDSFVDMAGPSADHSACAAKSARWVEPVFTARGVYPLHPNAAGMAGMAQVLSAAMRSPRPV
jgi:GDSL-like Lipase/Acylhydrolase family